MDPGAALALLELTASTTEADVRRAYARRLKDFRPDEDPEGFQRLVRARDAALAWARSSAKTVAAPPRAGLNGLPPKPVQVASPPAAEERAPEPEAPREASGRAPAQAREEETPPSAPENVPPPPARKPAPEKPAPSCLSLSPASLRTLPASPIPAGFQRRPRCSMRSVSV